MCFYGQRNYTLPIGSRPLSWGRTVVIVQRLHLFCRVSGMHWSNGTCRSRWGQQPSYSSKGRKGTCAASCMAKASWKRNYVTWTKCDVLPCSSLFFRNGRTWENHTPEARWGIAMYCPQFQMSPFGIFWIICESTGTKTHQNHGHMACILDIVDST